MEHPQPPQQPQPPQNSVQSPAPQQQQYYAQPPADNPGEALGIIGLVLGLLGLSLIGIFLSAMAYNKSKAVGASSTLGLVGIILNATFLIIGLLVIGFYILMFIVVVASGDTSGFDSSY